MHEPSATTQSPESDPANSKTLTAYEPSEEAVFAAIDDLIHDLNSELADNSEKMAAYRVFLDLALAAYLFFLLLGPFLDALQSHGLTALRPYQWVLFLEPPCLWLLAQLLLRPWKARTCSKSEYGCSEYEGRNAEGGEPCVTK